MTEQANNLSISPGPAENGNLPGTPASLSDRVRSLRLPETQAVRSSLRSSRIPWLLCIVFVCLSGYLGYRVVNAEAATLAKKESSRQVADDSKPGEQVSGKVALEAGGFIIPVRRVQVSPKVGGEVVELFIEEGQDVTKGQVLAKLDRSKYEFEYRRMKALTDQAQAELEKLQIGNREEEKEKAAAELREAQELLAQRKKEADRLRKSRPAASPDELDKIESLVKQAELRVEQHFQANKMMREGARKEDIEKARAALLHAIAQRDNAKYDLDNTEVLAPVSGRILVKRAEVGNTVRPEAFSNGLSASLCEMANLKELEVDVDIGERDLDRVFRNQPCEIRTLAFPNMLYKGYVARLMPEANRSKAMVPVRVRIVLPDNDHLLRPEMQARVTFLAR